MKMRCPWCAGLRVLISRMNHAKFYACPLCRGRGYLRVKPKKEVMT